MTDLNATSRLQGGARVTIAAVLLGLLLWTVFSWPTPRVFFSGIPSSARNAERGHVRTMIAGDHLQLLYHFWIAGDMIAGRTPLFHNLYEFNTGEDADRVEPGSFYVPFSAVYAAAAWVGGQAFGWNFAAVVSVILGFFLTWRLARRYVGHETAAAAGALIGTALPYRWITLLGGSPTGTAIALVPALLLGLDVAIRDERTAGGVLAGLALLLAFGADLHVFFFSVLAAPAWAVVALAAKDGRTGSAPRLLLAWVRALWPFAAFGLLAFWLSRIAADQLEAGTMAGGWELREVVRHTPWRRGLFTWRNMGGTNQIFIGVTPWVLIAAGGAALAVRGRPGGPSRIRPLILMAVLCAAAVGIVVLALGPNGPFDGVALRACRRVIPPYRMVRQTAKIFCLMPPVLAVALSIGLGGLLAIPRRRLSRTLCLAAIVLLPLVEYRLQLRPAVCRLDRDQAAYAAVAADARAAGAVPRALVLALWPGDSHWSSIYLHYASRYRIRLVNGYRPSVPTSYFHSTFKRFESFNQGRVADEQLDALLERGIGHLLLHEDAFPEKVSPFPVSLTLRRLLRHPRLARLEQDGAVWAFKILARPAARPATAEAPLPLFPARRWEMEQTRHRLGSVLDAQDASGGRVLSMATPGASATVTLRAPIAGAPGLHWLLRARGNGILVSKAVIDEMPIEAKIHPVHGTEWRWIRIPVPGGKPFFLPSLTLDWFDGTIELDACLLAAGPWTPPRPGESLRLPASSFFHAGYTDLETGRVVLRKERDPAREVFYGPMMPLDPGVYRIRLDFRTDAAPSVELGTLSVHSGDERLGAAEVSAGGPVALTVSTRANLPLRIGFTFARNADVALGPVDIARLAPDG
jgi:hypothetical protein